MPPENLAPLKRTVPPENSASSKSTLPPENSAPPKPTSPPENLAPPKPTSPPENSAPPKLTSPPENYGAAEADRAAGELGAAEADRAAGELGAVEVDRAAGELGVAEADLAAGELGAAKLTSPPENSAPLEADRAAGEPGAAEVTAVKDHAREVEVQALPGHRCVIFEVRGDDPDDGVADFAAGLEGKPLRRGSILARVGLVWHAQVGAQHIDAGLPVLLPVISQARHGIHPGQPDRRRLITPQLPGRRGEPLIQRPGALLRKRPVQLLALLRERWSSCLRCSLSAF